MTRTAFLLVLITTLWGCSSDLEINAPYKDITIVYGLLDAREQKQFIKVNKAYLGAGDALVYAQIPDSNEWNPSLVTGRVRRMLNGQEVGSFDLIDTLVTNREPGLFYSPDQLLYYFEDDFRGTINEDGFPTTRYLDEASEYELVLQVKGQEVRSTTTIIENFSFQGPDAQSVFPVELMSGSNYASFALNWQSGIHGKRYGAEYRFNYREIRGNEVSEEISSFTFQLGTRISAGTNSTEPMEVNMDGEEFFNAVANRVSTTDPTVTGRAFVGLDFIVSSANDEYHTYLTLSEPVTGIIEDRPSYTNIENGYGLFASRYTKSVVGKPLRSSTMAELADGNITSFLNFCTQHPVDVNSPYYCAP